VPECHKVETWSGPAALDPARWQPCPTEAACSFQRRAQTFGRIGLDLVTVPSAGNRMLISCWHALAHTERKG